jgi:S-adenosylmethionine decarboxylase proenzyme
MEALGLQIIADLYDCDRAALADEGAIREHMLAAAARAGATIVAQSFHRFSPHGVSGVVVIAESHLAIHTWPEHAFAAVDLFTCGASLDAEACLSYLAAALGSRRTSRTAVSRGERRLLERAGAIPG